MALSSPMKLTSSASFSPSIRISLRLKIHQAQAKNFCRVLDIRVAQVVKADMPQVVLLQRFAEAAGKICWANPFPQFIDANVICKLPAVRLTADFSVLFLLFLQSEKHFSHSRHKRQGTAAGASLGRVRRDNLVLPVNRASSHCVPNANGVMHKVNGIPAQAHHLAAAQTIEGCQFHRHFNQRI